MGGRGNARDATGSEEWKNVIYLLMSLINEGTFPQG